MIHIYDNICANAGRGKKMLAILLDPDKCSGSVLADTLAEFEKCTPDFIFIGGSSGMCNSDDLLQSLQHIPSPKILFPGDASQFNPGADGLLFLSLISGRNADYLIGQHVQSAIEIKKSDVEVIPTGYILIDGGNHSSVQRVSNTTPIGADHIDECISTAVAGELLGMKLIYLEAGSGAAVAVSAEMISAVKQKLNIPLIVGGGIKTTEQLTSALNAGADLIVVGNIFETETGKIAEFVNYVKNF